MMTAIAIAPRMFSNIMDKPSQLVASAKVKRSDRKGGSANRDIDHVEEKDGHLIILFGASCIAGRHKRRLLTCFHDRDRTLI